MYQVRSFLPLILLVSFFAHAQDVETQLNVPTYPIERVDGSCEPESYGFLDEVIGEARVVALGEASHGTGTITREKRCLTAYLVEHQGFSVVAFEAFYTLMDRANGYIQGEREDVTPFLGSFAFYIYGTEEVYDFFEWARAYNLSRPVEERFRVVGVDIDALRGTAEDVLSFVELADPAFLNEARSAYSDILTFYSEGIYKGEANTHNDIEDAERVAAHLESHRETYLQDYPEALVERGLHSAEIVAQHLDYILDYSLEQRDAFMAQSVQTLLENGDKVIFWAHNGHIREGDQPFVAAGTHLAKVLGDDYFSVAITFSEGMNRRLITNRQNFSDCIGDEHTEQKNNPERPTTSCVERVPPPLDGSLEAFLLDLSLANTLVDLRSEKNLPPLLAKPVPMRHIGRTSQAEAYQFTNLGKNYDALIFLDKVTAATDLQPPYNPFKRGEEADQ